MKLRTRLIISFFIIILVPVLLAGATMWGIGKYQMRAIRQIYDTDGNAYDYFLNSFEALSSFTKSTYEELQRVAKDAPEQLANQEYLDEVNRKLEDRYSYLGMEIQMIHSKKICRSMIAMYYKGQVPASIWKVKSRR